MDHTKIWTKEDRQSLIDLIEWYRDDYHRNVNFCHSYKLMIETIKTTTSEETLDIYEKIVDDWLDY